MSGSEEGAMCGPADSGNLNGEIRRYRLTVRTEPSQGLNTGSIPVSATKPIESSACKIDLEFCSAALRRRRGQGAVPHRIRAGIQEARELSLLENGWTGRSRLACASVSQADWKQMRKVLGITLGIMTALGGFVDFGQIVFTLQAGASFRYALLWPIVLGTIAII
jgi:hypothetical protein